MTKVYLRIKPGDNVANHLAQHAPQGSDHPQYYHLTGVIESARLTPAPGAEPLAISTKAYLVSGTALVKDNRVKLMGCLSWVFDGAPSYVAGRLSKTISGGIHAFLVQHDGPWSQRNTQPFDVNTLQSKVDDADEPITDAVRLTSPEQSLASTTEMPRLDAVVQTQGGWADAVAAQLGSPGGEELTLDDELKRGDVLLHPRFGPCTVIKPPSFGKIKVRRENGAFVDLHMKILQLTPTRDPRFDRAFKVLIGKPGP